MTKRKRLTIAVSAVAFLAAWFAVLTSIWGGDGFLWAFAAMAIVVGAVCVGRIAYQISSGQLTISLAATGAVVAWSAVPAFVWGMDGAVNAILSFLIFAVVGAFIYDALPSDGVQ